MRINQYVSRSTNLSRRKAEELVLAGKVKISHSSVIPALNQVQHKHPAGIQSTAKTVTNLATEVGSSDKVYLNNKLITPQKFVYYALNKPTGYTTTTSDPHAKKIITDLVPKNPPVFPVGRLDKDTSGLIFLTNDGDFAQKLTHPKYEKEKEYIVETDRELSEKDLNRIRTGIKLSNGITAPAKVTLLCHSDRPYASSERRNPFPSYQPQKNTYSITIHEGRNRQIRRMMEAVGTKVIKLKRIRIGDFELGDLREGKYKTFNP